MTEPTLQISLREQYFLYKLLAVLRGKCPGERFPFRSSEETFAALYDDGIHLVAEAHLHLQVEESGQDLIRYSEQMASVLLASLAVLDRANVDLLVEQSMILGFKSFLYQESATRIRWL